MSKLFYSFCFFITVMCSAGCGTDEDAAPTFVLEDLLGNYAIVGSSRPGYVDCPDWDVPLVIAQAQAEAVNNAGVINIARTR